MRITVNQLLKAIHYVQRTEFPPDTREIMVAFLENPKTDIFTEGEVPPTKIGHIFFKLDDGEWLFDGVQEQTRY